MLCYRPLHLMSASLAHAHHQPAKNIHFSANILTWAEQSKKLIPTYTSGTDKSNKTQCNDYDLHGSPVISDSRKQFVYLQVQTKVRTEQTPSYLQQQVEETWVSIVRDAGLPESLLFKDVNSLQLTNQWHRDSSWVRNHDLLFYALFGNTFSTKEHGVI